MLDTYIINLKRATQRWTRMTQRLSTSAYYRIHRIPGVEGTDLDLQHVALDSATTRRYFGQDLGKGSIGCYLSHVNAWEALIASNAPYGLILEDDAYFDAQDMMEVIHSLMALPQENCRTIWDICSFQLNHRGFPIPVARLLNGLTLSTYLACITGAGAYLLTQHGAQRLRQCAFPIQWPVDHYYTKTHCLKLRFVGVQPRIAKQEEGPSFIEAAGRERFKDISMFKRFMCAVRKIGQEARQGIYNGTWALWRYLRKSHCSDTAVNSVQYGERKKP